MKQKIKLISIVALAAMIAATGYMLGVYSEQTGSGVQLINEAEAAGGMVKGPNKAAPDRYVYYPGTEELAKDEIRVIACGTGLPAARRSQAATCFLIEAGNGEKYLFDIGTGSMGNIASLMIPYQYLDKVFLSHLHTDHCGLAAGQQDVRTRLESGGPAAQNPRWAPSMRWSTS
jgi:ribonuclease Z